LGFSKRMTRTDSHLDFPTEIVHEGKERFLVPKLNAFVKTPSEYAPSKAPVFYNPIMELNRDVAVLVVRIYQRMVDHEVTVCEPLASSGIRGVRLAGEVEGVGEVVINDISTKAVQIANCNVRMNKLESKIIVKHEDANLLLSRHGAPHRRFDVIDLDPFGSPVPFIGSAVRALCNGGLLALTATDMAPLCGVHPKACIRKYGGKPLRTEYCHELAIRLLAGCLAAMSAKHEMGIEVVFAHVAAHYVRVYTVIEYGAKKADESLKNMGYVLHCFKCFHRETLPSTSLVGDSGKCGECNSRLSLAGPLWIGKLFNREFCRLMIDENERALFKNKERIRRMLALADGETDAPATYYVHDELCDSLSLRVPPVKKLLEALKRNGFQASPTCFNPKGIRTDAPASKLVEFLEDLQPQTGRR
jgi:tRNA (guanine26-N2/guanine27-N2)-dimethyltransferase